MTEAIAKSRSQLTTRLRNVGLAAAEGAVATGALASVVALSLGQAGSWPEWFGSVPGPPALWLASGIAGAIWLGYRAYRNGHRALGQAAASIARYERLMEASPDAIVRLDDQGVVRSINRAAETLSGIPRAEMIGRRFDRLGLLSASDTTCARDEFRRLLGGEKRPIRAFELRAARGTAFVEANANRVDLADGTAELQVSLRDVTARVEAEQAQEQLARRLQVAGRLEAIGRLAGGFAHDLNNLFTVIVANTALLRETLASHPELQQVEEIQQALDRATTLVRQLLASGGKQKLQLETVELGQLASGLAPLLHRLAGDNVSLSLEGTDTHVQVKVDCGQIEQVVLNLVSNARDAMPGGGRMTLRTSVRHVSEPEEAVGGAIARGHYAVLTVRDEGIGMDERTLQEIFEPFFTTKGNRHGTGLGLATVLGIVRQSGGHITVRSTPGRGTRFEVLLPAVFPDDRSAPASGAGPEPRARVLLVDDDPLVRRSVARALRRAGYDLASACSAEERLVQAVNAILRSREADDRA